MLFVCPKCYEKLNITNSGAAVCKKGHSYDKSRFGYYNLLLSEKGGIHGDNKEMISARREFLSHGFYEPLAKNLALICKDFLEDNDCLLDAGCGEGYYTEFVKRALKEAGVSVRVCAFDISKDAVRAAAKRGAADEYAVAGSYHMPVPDKSVSLLLNTFSPQAKEETYRVLKPGGHFVMAIPAEEHLYGLKAKVYDNPYKNKVEDTHLEGFELVRKKEVKYTIKLDTRQDIQSLFMMTPYAYRTSKEGKERVLSLENLSTDVHFFILTYKKADN